MNRHFTLIFALLSLTMPSVGAFAETSKSFEPEMVPIPGGTFDMGCVSGRNCELEERPVRRVTIKPFAIGKYEVTVGEYMACVKAGSCDEPEWHEKDSAYNIETGTKDLYKELGEALTGDRHPIVGVSRDNAKQYAKWLSGKTGKHYRLPTAAEWEYAARAMNGSTYWWGNEASHEYANYGKDECCGGLAKGADKWVTTAPVGSFPKNEFGVHDMHGNVWEWMDDCWHSNYRGAPKDGSAWQKTDDGSCGLRDLRGGSWFDRPKYLRSAFRGRDNANGRYDDVGFRLYSSSGGGKQAESSTPNVFSSLLQVVLGEVTWQPETAVE